jgi:nucleotidyltransferase/DNA polymerase involved in DNA repair
MSNNKLESSMKINVRIMGDINHDNKVGIADISLAARAFGSRHGDPRWNPDADINQDQKIDLKDIALVAKQFGKWA